MNTTEIEKLIVSYKAHLKNDRLKDELYKWQLLAKFKGRPRLDAPDFSAEIKRIDYSNLIYHSGLTVIKQFADGKPVAYKNCFENLFNENIPLIERIKAFDSKLLSIYRELYENNGHHHDERTIATFLTFRNPEKYTFYKDSFYRKYCDLIGITSRKKGEKYVHYLELVDDLIENYIKKDTELIELFQEIISSDDYYQDRNFKILAQDILYQMLDKGEKENEEPKEDQRQDTLNLFTTMEATTNETNLNVNTILYGSPGTGKTYSTIELAYRAIKGDAAFKQDGYDVAKQWFKNELAKSEDRQLDFITFHQNYSYEDFVIGIKPDLNEGDGLNFKRHEGIFFKICQRALKNYEDDQKPIEIIEQEKGLEELFEGFKDSISEYLEQNKDGVYSITDAVNIVEVKDNAFIYLGHNWNRNARGNQMKFKDIFLIYNNEKAKDRQSALLTPEISGLARNHISWYFKIVNEFKKFVKNHKGNVIKSDKKIELKNYVIIIDEINRANISRVFGELITLDIMSI